MLNLLDHPLSPYSQKCKIALYEKSVPFEVTTPEGLGTGESEATFLGANPRGEVPTLIDGDVSIFDSTVILEYLEDKWPDPALLPRDAALRARARMLEDIADTYHEAINWGLMELRIMKRGAGTDLPDQIEARADSQIKGLYAWLERQLGEAAWFGGDRFGWADAAIIPHAIGSAAFGFEPAQGSALEAWMARANARPSVANCVKAVEEFGGAAALSFIPDLIKQGLFKREYRDHRLEWMIRSGGLDIVREGLKADTIRCSNEIT